MNKSHLFAALLSMILSVILLGSIIINYIVYNSYSNLIRAYDNYNKNCEILLDSIASWDESFYDATVETDVYQNYLDSRDNLDYLIWDK